MTLNVEIRFKIAEQEIEKPESLMMGCLALYFSYIGDTKTAI